MNKYTVQDRLVEFNFTEQMFALILFLLTFKNLSLRVYVVVQWVKLQRPTTHIRVRSTCGSSTWFQLPVNAPETIADDGSKSWVPANHMGTQVVFHTCSLSLVQSGPVMTVVTTGEVILQTEVFSTHISLSLFLSLCISLSPSFLAPTLPPSIPL